MLKHTGKQGYITEHIAKARLYYETYRGAYASQLRYPGGPTRVPKNGNAVRYPGRPHGPPGYAMDTWRLCARATRVNRHFEENMASLNKFSLICDVSFDDVFIKRYRCEKTHPSITKMYGKLLMTWRIFGVMASASNNDHDDVVRPTHVMSVLVMLKTNKMFILTIPARGSKRNVTPRGTRPLIWESDGSHLLTWF